MISLFDGQITDILPISLKYNPEVQALSYAISNSNKRILNYAKKISLYAAIDELDDNLLDILATDLNVQFYDEGYDIDIKRNLIKKALLWWMKAGTKSAVEELVSTVFGSGEVQEWFEYDGKPFFFRISVDKSVTQEQIDKIHEIINKVKNCRSHLEYIISTVYITETRKIYAAGTVVNTINYTLTCDINDTYEVKANIEEGSKEVVTLNYNLT